MKAEERLNKCEHTVTVQRSTVDGCEAYYLAKEAIALLRSCSAAMYPPTALHPPAEREWRRMVKEFLDGDA